MSRRRRANSAPIRKMLIDHASVLNRSVHAVTMQTMPKVHEDYFALNLDVTQMWMTARDIQAQQWCLKTQKMISSKEQGLRLANLCFAFAMVLQAEKKAERAVFWLDKSSELQENPTCRTRDRARNIRKSMPPIS